jgi:dethiobiotin synthetase
MFFGGCGRTDSMTSFLSSRPAPLRGCFVTGTDTGVGKTQASAALLHALGAQGYKVAGLKPVAAGCEPGEAGGVNDDVNLLLRASNVTLSEADVGPCQLRTACAPHLAARIEGVTISRPALLAAARALAQRADLLVVEGVGGFRVPLGDDWDSADLAVDLGLPVVMVVGLRLGCLSHALLTAEAVRARGLRLAGWIANPIDPGMPLAANNLAALTERLQAGYGAARLAVLPWLDLPTPARLAEHLNAAVLGKALALPARKRWLGA